MNNENDKSKSAPRGMLDRIVGQPCQHQDPVTWRCKWTDCKKPKGVCPPVVQFEHRQTVRRAEPRMSSIRCIVPNDQDQPMTAIQQTLDLPQDAAGQSLAASPCSAFRCIVADPPWRYKTTMAVTGNAPGRTRQNGRSKTDYPTMTLDEIEALPVKKLADPTGCHLYLWTTNTHVEYVWRIARSWGFEPKNLLTWCKPPKGMIGFGTFSGCTEFVLYAQMGPTVKIGRCERTWWEWSRSLRHSAKPEPFFDVVEKVSPGPYLELFARRKRPGWASWGNEIESDIIMPNAGADRPETKG